MGFAQVTDYITRIVPDPIKLDYASRSDGCRAEPADISQGIIAAFGFAAHGGLGLMFLYEAFWAARPIDLPTIALFVPLGGLFFWQAIAAAVSASCRD